MGKCAAIMAILPSSLSLVDSLCPNDGSGELKQWRGQLPSQQPLAASTSPGRNQEPPEHAAACPCPQGPRRESECPRAPVRHSRRPSSDEARPCSRHKPPTLDRA